MTVAFLERCKWLCYPNFLLDRNSYYSTSLFFAIKNRFLSFLPNLRYAPLDNR